MRALWNALEIFDKSRGFQFETLLGKCVLNECRKTNKTFFDFYKNKKLKVTSTLPELLIFPTNKNLIQKLTSLLNKQERNIIHLKFYLNYTEPEIGKIYGVTRSRINQIVWEIYRKIQKVAKIIGYP